MRRSVLLAVLLFALAPLSRAQVDSLSLAALDKKMDEYFIALTFETMDTKIAECDFMVESCSDSLLRQHIALRIYDHYLESKLMGDEAVAVHMVDEWFATGKVAMADEIDLINARVFADFNRNTLLDMQAPVLEMETIDGGLESFPCEGRVSILFFYDTGCAKCSLETILMKHVLEESDTEVEFYAICLGTDHDEWEEYVSSHLDFSSPTVTMHHLWDPEMDTDFQRLYGVLQTPRIFLTDPDGTIIGRGLDSEALKKLLPYAGMLQELYDRCPVGSKLPEMTMEMTKVKNGKSRTGFFSTSKVKGKPAYMIFHTHGCKRCEAALEAASGMKRATVFLVDTDRVLEQNPALSEQLFDSFDLTVLPYIIELDRKGVVSQRYVSLGEDNE